MDPSDPENAAKDGSEVYSEPQSSGFVEKEESKGIPESSSTPVVALKKAKQVVPYLFLALAVTMMSSAGAMFALLKGVPPFLQASWRLWATR